jgi:hypothetical protein
VESQACHHKYASEFLKPLQSINEVQASVRSELAKIERLGANADGNHKNLATHAPLSTGLAAAALRESLCTIWTCPEFKPLQKSKVLGEKSSTYSSLLKEEDEESRARLHK